MSVDFCLHVVNTERERYHCNNYMKKEFWSSKSPFSASENSENKEFLENWHYGFWEFLYNGEWIHENAAFNLPEEEFNKIDFENGRRTIYVYCDVDGVVYKTDSIRICDSRLLDQISEESHPEIIYGDKLVVIDENLIKDVIRIAENKKRVKEFMKNNVGKECFIIGW